MNARPRGHNHRPPPSPAPLPPLISRCRYPRARVCSCCSGGAVSAIFLLSNFHAHLADCFPYGEGDAKRKMYLLLGSMGVFHVVLVFLFKIYFFHYRP